MKFFSFWFWRVAARHCVVTVTTLLTAANSRKCSCIYYIRHTLLDMRRDPNVTPWASAQH